MLGLAVAAVTFGLMAATESRLAIVWDEAYTLPRLYRMRAWFEAVRDPVGFAATWDSRELPAVEDRLR
jgi:hypothetical protein